MDYSRYRGRLERWEDDRGFGFICPENSSRNVFIHISALKNMSRRPVVGDVISFRVETDADGKPKAVDAAIVGVPVIRSRPAKRRRRKGEKDSSLLSGLAVLVVIAIVGYSAFDAWSSRQAPMPAVAKPIAGVRSDPVKYRCDGRKHCSEMTSCEEARFFLHNCPGTKMDGDRDGVPCERQFCN